VAYSVPQFAVGRFVIGLGVGAAAMIVPLYISEIAPAKYRGRMVAFNNTSVTLGQLVASCIGAGCAHFHNGWRLTVGFGGIPPIILAGLLFMCPESPRQLVAHGKGEAAEAVLTRIYPTSTHEQREAKLKSIELSINQSTSSMSQDSLWTSFKHILQNPATGRAVLTACVIMAISQLGGFNTLMYYAATLFSIVGWENPTAVGITVSAANFVFGIVTIFLVDRAGRRMLLSISVAGMAICLAIAAIAFHYIPINKDLVLETETVGWPGIVILVTIICYVGFFSSGVAPISWVGTELMPLEVRAVGTMLNTATCWGTNIIISSTFLSMMKGITPSGAFGFYCGICSVGWIFIIFFYPECKGMPLEAIREVFSQGFGVRYSKKWQKENKHLRVQTEAAIGH
jgi:MFS transporter, SP family, solute carrier family 2 (myo-inositol transporter), member 13